ncbi:MAG: hypothetical protein HQL48_05345, partial [Gammaproteobacteria bacterium]|nr:hypothetical protein [Gammaproteobacteria bacterium]
MTKNSSAAIRWTRLSAIAAGVAMALSCSTGDDDSTSTAATTTPAENTEQVTQPLVIEKSYSTKVVGNGYAVGCTVTDSAGNTFSELGKGGYKLAGTPSGKITATGCTDSATNEKMGVLVAPALESAVTGKRGRTFEKTESGADGVVSLLTTMKAKLIDKGMTPEEARKKVNKMVGLPEETDVSQLDHLATSTQSGSTVGKTVVTAVSRSIAQLNSTMEIISRATGGSVVSEDILDALMDETGEDEELGVVLKDADKLSNVMTGKFSVAPEAAKAIANTTKKVNDALGTKVFGNNTEDEEVDTAELATFLEDLAQLTTVAVRELDDEIDAAIAGDLTLLESMDDLEEIETLAEAIQIAKEGFIVEIIEEDEPEEDPETDGATTPGGELTNGVIGGGLSGDAGDEIVDTDGEGDSPQEDGDDPAASGDDPEESDDPQDEADDEVDEVVDEAPVYVDPNPYVPPTEPAVDTSCEGDEIRLMDLEEDENGEINIHVWENDHYIDLRLSAECYLPEPEDQGGSEKRRTGYQKPAVFTVYVSGGNDADKFMIDSKGWLRFIDGATPDYENPGDSDGDNIYNIEVTATEGRRTITKKFNITVNDQTVELEYSEGSIDQLFREGFAMIDPHGQQNGVPDVRLVALGFDTTEGTTISETSYTLQGDPETRFSDTQGFTEVLNDGRLVPTADDWKISSGHHFSTMLFKESMGDLDNLDEGQLSAETADISGQNIQATLREHSWDGAKIVDYIDPEALFPDGASLSYLEFQTDGGSLVRFFWRKPPQDQQASEGTYCGDFSPELIASGNCETTRLNRPSENGGGLYGLDSFTPTTLDELFATNSYYDLFYTNDGRTYARFDDELGEVTYLTRLWDEETEEWLETEIETLSYETSILSNGTEVVVFDAPPNSYSDNPPRIALAVIDGFLRRGDVMTYQNEGTMVLNTTAWNAISAAASLGEDADNDGVVNAEDPAPFDNRNWSVPEVTSSLWSSSNASVFTRVNGNLGTTDEDGNHNIPYVLDPATDTWVGVSGNLRLRLSYGTVNIYNNGGFEYQLGHEV